MLFWAPLALLASWFPPGLAQNATDSLSFSVLSGGNSNVFIRDNISAAQVVLTANASALQRLVVALPAGNSGALAYFLANGSDTLGVLLVNGSLRTTTQAFGMVGIRGTLAFSSNASLGVTILGATRAVRDYVEGGGVMHEVFNYTVANYSSSRLVLHRPFLRSSYALDLALNASSGMSARRS